MPASINGIGTTWYGNALEEQDGSYVVTEWIIFFFVPIIPLGSKRIWPVPKKKIAWWKIDTEYTGIIGGDKFNVVRVPLHMPHIFKGYAVAFAIFVLYRTFFD